MIIGKRGVMPKLLLLIFIVAALLLSVSCQKQSNDDVLDRLESLRNDLAESEEAADGFLRYRIVVPESCSEKLLSASEILAQSINANTGKNCSVVRDGETLTEGSDVGEILLGTLDREESREILSPLNRDDYVCCFVGETVVVGGKTEAATVAAVERFASEISDTCGGALLDGCSFEYYCSYTYTDAVLWGCDLGNMTVVCTDETNLVATLWRDAVADRCGDYPRLNKNVKATDGSCELIFCLDLELEGLARINFDGEDVWLSSDTEYGLSVAAEGLAARLFEKNEGRAEINGDREVSFLYGISEISVGLVAEEIGVQGDLSDVVTVGRYVLDSNHDAVVFERVRDEVVTEIKAAIDSQWQLESVSLGNGMSVVVVYFNEEFLLSDVDASINDGVLCVELTLENKESGKIYKLSQYDFGRYSEPDLTSSVTDAFGGSSCSAVVVKIPLTEGELCAPAGTRVAYSEKQVALGYEARVLALVDLYGNTVAGGYSDAVCDGGADVTCLDIQMRWSEEFFALVFSESENNSGR